MRYIIDSHLITPNPKKVYWISEGAVADKHHKYTYIEDGIPEASFLDNLTDAAVVLDDCQVTASDSDAVSKLFRRLSHHNRLIVFFIVQNLNFIGKRALDVRRNCDYYVLFKNAADHDQYQRFQTKFGITKWGVSLNHMLEHVTLQNPHFCLIVDLKYDTPELLRFRCDPRMGNGQYQRFIAVRGSHQAQLSGADGIPPVTPADSQSPNTMHE